MTRTEDGTGFKASRARPGEFGRRLRGLGWLLAAAGVLGAGDARAQGVKTPVELQETDVFGMGARALGMGGAYSAVSEDVTALAYNPAGLAQIRRVELSGGLAYDDATHTVTHFARRSDNATATRLDHIALAYPIPTYRGSLVLGFGFHRGANLDDNLIREGFAIAPAGSTPGLFELEQYSRNGTLNKWTAAVSGDLSRNISVGASLSYVSGNSDESLTLANYRAVPGGNGVTLDLGDPSSPDERLFRQDVTRHESVDGYTGSFGILGYLGSGVRLAAVVDLPTKLTWTGDASTRLEDWQKVDTGRSSFEDKMTLPLSLRGGLSWGRSGLLLAGGVRWTDYRQIDFEGKILAPASNDGGVTFQEQPAYRSVVAVNLGGEYQIPTLPLRLRAGFFTEPLPYKLIAADTDFQFVPDDNDPNTTTDASIVYRDYPFADIVSDRKFVTAGAGVILQDALTLDAAVVYGSWERRTPANYENGTTFYPAVTTTEKVRQTRVLVSTTLHFE